MKPILASLTPALSRLHLRDQWLRLRRQLGAAGFAALVLIVAAAIFEKAAVEPLQVRSSLVTAKLERQGGAAPAQAASGVSGNLETLYSHLNRSETTTDWLAKLYAIGKATGVELQSGTYKSVAAGDGKAARIERYEIVLPVSGSYAQMRDFLNRALGEIPVLSLDQLTLKRETRNDGAVQAELKLTLHMVKP